MDRLGVVAAAPPLRLRDVFEQSSGEHVIILTYSFDLPFFESYLLPILVRRGARSIAVAADARWLSTRLPMWLKDDEVREAGRRYTLSGILVPGSFHPKVVLLATESRGTLLIGSGNIGARGLTTTGELFTHVSWVEGMVPPLAQQAWSLCRHIGDVVPVDTVFAQRVQEMGSRIPGLSVASRSAQAAGQRLVHNLDEPLIDQLVRHVGGRAIDDLLAWSPFTDHKLGALGALLDRLRPANVTLAVQPGVTNLDGARLASMIETQPDIDWRIVELRASGGGQENDLIHGKGVLLRCSGEDILLAGSPNLSRPALLATASGDNVEVALLMEGTGLHRALFGDGSPVTIGAPIAPSSLTWTDEPRTGGRAPDLDGPRLLGALRDGQTLTLTVRGICPPDAVVELDDGRSLPLASTDPLCVVLQDDDAPRGVTLCWGDGRSGPVIVAEAAHLAAFAHRGGVEARTPLDALDYGGDNDLLAILDELAALAIISVRDVIRVLRGHAGPTAYLLKKPGAGILRPLSRRSME